MSINRFFRRLLSPNVSFRSTEHQPPLTLAKDLEQKSKVQQQTTGEMLKAAFSEHEKSVRAELNESEKRISAAIHDHDRMLSSAMSQRTKGMLRMVSQTWLTIVLSPCC